MAKSTSLGTGFKYMHVSNCVGSFFAIIQSHRTSYYWCYFVVLSSIIENQPEGAHVNETFALMSSFPFCQLVLLEGSLTSFVHLQTSGVVPVIRIFRYEVIFCSGSLSNLVIFYRNRKSRMNIMD